MSPSLARAVLGELHYDALADDHSAAGLADDCLRLLRTSEADFRAAKDQSWYQRIWRTFGGKNLRKVGASCAHVAHAQALVVELLRAVGRNHQRGMRLVELVAEDLERVRERQGALSGRLRRIYDEIAKLKQQLRHQRTQVVDENDLPEKERVLILRAMVAAAWADGRIQDAEAELIARKIESLNLSEKARRTIAAELRAPKSLGSALASIDSPKVRRLLYRNVAAVVMADGQIQTRETMFLAQLAAALGIPRQESGAIDEELYHLVSVRGLDTLVGAVVRHRALKEAPPEAARRRQDAEDAQRRNALMDQLAEGWMTVMGGTADLVCEAIQAPLFARLAAYRDEPDILKCFEIIDVAAIRTELLRQADEALDRLDAAVDGQVVASFPFLRAPGQGVWSLSAGKGLRVEVQKALAAGLAALQRVPALEQEVRQLEAAEVERLLKSGALGFAAGVLPGGRGYRDPKLETAAARALQDYGDGLEAGLDAMDSALGRVHERIIKAAAAYFDDVLVPALGAADTGWDALESFKVALLEAQPAAVEPGAN
jgi:uncharacterized tellurite resistance protein B-like protein